jgi:hypothetical protein
MIPDLSKKDADIDGFAKIAQKDKKMLSELLDALTSKEETYRYNCHKVLMVISQEKPALLYPEWDRLEELLKSDHTYWKMSALMIMANLTEVDSEKRFEKIFDRYYSLLDDRSMVVAVYVARFSGKIAKAKPNLESKITRKLLKIDETHHNEGRKALIKSGVIEAFSEYYDSAKNKKKIVEFAKQQLESESPKTRKLAKEFLENLD